MKTVIQRVKNARVKIRDKTAGQIKSGLLIFLGIEQNDDEETALWLAKKIIGLRIFSDDREKMNLPVKDVKGEILVISQFTLCADLNSGNRPSFIKAAEPQKGEELYNFFVNSFRSLGIKTETGIFGAKMEVELINDGPVTIILEKRA